MKTIIITCLLLISATVFADQKTSEYTMKSEELTLTTIESKITTGGELAPGLHDLLTYELDNFLSVIKGRLINNYYSFGEAPDQKRIDALVLGYRNLASQLVRNTNPRVASIELDFVSAFIRTQYKDVKLIKTGAELESWTFTFDNDLNPTSRFIIAQVAYQKKGETFTRIDHLIYREPFVNGDFNPSQARLEVRSTEWVSSINTN